MFPSWENTVLTNDIFCDFIKQKQKQKQSKTKLNKTEKKKENNVELKEAYIVCFVNKKRRAMRISMEKFWSEHKGFFISRPLGKGS